MKTTAKPVSQFVQTVKQAPREHVLLVQTRLLKAYTTSGMSDDGLRKAIDTLDTEPGWFHNLNPIYQDIILDSLKHLGNDPSTV